MGLSFTFHSPTKILFGRGSLQELGEQVKRLGGKALLVTGRRFARRYGYIDRLTSLMEAAGVKVALFDRVEPNPSFETVEEGASTARKTGVDVVVGFGGGSALDAAKAIALLCVQGGRARDYVYPYVVEEPVLPIVAIPTTCGTGSEVTKFSVLTDVKAKRKTVVAGGPLIPKVAILDPEVLRHLPRDLTVYTALDAFSHAIEAYWSKASQPISDLFALESMKILLKDLEKAAQDVEARDVLHYASLLAGLAINQAGTTVVHAMGYYLTTYHDVHHGLSNAVFLPVAVRLNASAIPDKVSRLADYLGLEYESVEAAARLIEESLAGLEDRLGVPRRLGELGVDRSEVEVFVKETLSYRRNIENNPRELTEDDVRSLFMEII